VNVSPFPTFLVSCVCGCVYPFGVDRRELLWCNIPFLPLSPLFRCEPSGSIRKRRPSSLVSVSLLLVYTRMHVYVRAAIDASKQTKQMRAINRGEKKNLNYSYTAL
jgi:hypothetical protein